MRCKLSEMFLVILWSQNDRLMMKKLFLTAVTMVMFALPVLAQLRGDVNGDNTVDVADVNELINIVLGKDVTEMKLLLTIDGGNTLTATLADNATTRALTEALRQSPITYQASDYGGFEKVGALGRTFVTADEYITTQPGDIMLYQGSSLVIFYGSNSWQYTPVGKIEGLTVEQLKSALKAGQGTVAITLSLP